MSDVVVEIAIADSRLASRIRRVLAELPGLSIWAGDGDREPDVTIAGEAPEEGADTPHLVLAEAPEQAAALRAGAAGVLGPGAGARELHAAILAASCGLCVMVDELAQELLDGAFGPDAREDAAAQVAVREAPLLSPREQEVLALLADGASNKMVARELGISVHTAKFHVAQLIAKLGAATRTDAVARAVRLGLLML